MSIIDLEDAVRAAQDRPSMEAELQELREQLLATEKARDYHIEQLGQLRDDNKLLCGVLGEAAWKAYQAGYAAGVSKMPKENMQNDFEICCRVEEDK